MILYTDQIKLYSITRDKFGVHTEGEAVTYNCIIEDTNKIFMSNKGQTEKANALIMIDKTFTGVKGDLIELYKQFGSETGDSKKYEIKQVFTTGGLTASHKEVYI